MARSPKNPKPGPVSAINSGHVGRQLGAVARRVRESQDLTLTDVATSAGISAGMLSRLETGHVTPSEPQGFFGARMETKLAAMSSSSAE